MLIKRFSSGLVQAKAPFQQASFPQHDGDIHRRLSHTHFGVAAFPLAQDITTRGS
jgi:hypothetical protein